jgi:hypothetical protein
MRFDIETQASPEQVHRALTDFTQERLHIWNRTLDPKTYELREHEPNRAVARESTLGRRSGWSPATTSPTLPWFAGLPVTTARRRDRVLRSASDDSCDSRIRLASRARIRLARPTLWVCSCITNGRRSSHAATPTGTDTYPPVENTTSGRSGPPPGSPAGCRARRAPGPPNSPPVPADSATCAACPWSPRGTRSARWRRYGPPGRG